MLAFMSLLYRGRGVRAPNPERWIVEYNNAKFVYAKCYLLAWPMVWYLLGTKGHIWSGGDITSFGAMVNYKIGVLDSALILDPYKVPNIPVHVPIFWQIWGCFCQSPIGLECYETDQLSLVCPPAKQKHICY